MTAPTLAPADALKESMITADYARNCEAREVAAWCLAHHPDLPIAIRWRQSEDAYISLQRAFVAAQSKEDA